ncbi:MAG TPA: TetR family transcriptional regulator [Solirubrobacteraceae bacterium]|nr:TetR family transcriptional regulator [Solirubrobacteraceae bacterium]
MGERGGRRAPRAATAPEPVEPAPLRADAARSREAILASARELFASGRDVPMYEIGRHAGVGQATLYRHFGDRPAIVAAISREQVERIEQIAAEHATEADAILIVLEASAEMLASIHDLVAILRDEATLAPVLAELRARMRAVLEGALARSRPSGVLGPDVAADDLVLVLNMVNGALGGVVDQAERSAVAARALALALDGLRTR